MEFNFDESAQAIRDLTEQIISDNVDHASLKALAATGERFDLGLWQTLADAGIVGACLPEANGGSGLDFLAAAATLEVVGTHAAPVPFLETVVLAALPIAEFGTDAQREAYLDRIAAGDLIATAALAEAIGTEPIRADAEGDGWRINGSAFAVRAGLDAGLVLVPADTGSARGIFLVPVDTPGVGVDELPSTTGISQAVITFDAVDLGADALLGGELEGDAQLVWIGLRADSGICSLTAGLCASSLQLMADYAKIRHQFDRAIATFQAVSQRAADTFIDTEAVTLTARQAAWRIASGRPAQREVAIARWWASEGGFRVVHASTHVHGGVGVDRDYPLHRFFLMARELELTLGSAEHHLEALGDLIAAS